MITIGEAMKKARLDKGYSRNTLSFKALISIQNISNWEAGRAYPNIINLIAIADALGVTLDELVGRAMRDEKEK